MWYGLDEPIVSRWKSKLSCCTVNRIYTALGLSWPPKSDVINHEPLTEQPDKRINGQKSEVGRQESNVKCEKWKVKTQNKQTFTQQEAMFYDGHRCRLTRIGCGTTRGKDYKGLPNNCSANICICQTVAHPENVKDDLKVLSTCWMRVMRKGTCGSVCVSDRELPEEGVKYML